MACYVFIRVMSDNLVRWFDPAPSARRGQTLTRYIPDASDTHTHSVVGESRPAIPAWEINGTRAHAYLLSSEYRDSPASLVVDPTVHTAPLVGTEESHRGTHWHPE